MHGGGGSNSFASPIYPSNGQTIGSGGPYRLEDGGGGSASCAHYKNIYGQSNVITNAAGLISSDPMLSASAVSNANEYMLRTPPAGPLSADSVGPGNPSYDNTWMATPSGYNSFGYDYVNNTGGNHSTLVQPSYFYNSR